MAKRFHTIYDHAVVSSPHGGSVSLTDQQYRDDCDINHILVQFRATGKLPIAREGVSGDFSDIGDYQQCLDRINHAKDEFAALPSDLRARFGNDPTAYVKFCLDPANVDECVRLGLRVKPAPKEDTAVDVLKRIEKGVTPKKEQAGA